MALLSELVSVCEDHRVDTGATLTVFARRLREAGRLSQAGRGRGAAHMTYLDAARFLIACAATDHPERAVDAEFVFSNLMRADSMGTDDSFPLPKAEFPTLDTALAEVLRAMGNGEVTKVANERWEHPTPAPQHCWLRVNRSGAGADLRLLDGRSIYHHPALVAVTDSVREAGGSAAMKVAASAFERETHRFRTGKNLTAELEGSLLQSVAKLIAEPRK